MLSNLNNCLELTAAELDLVILANIQVFSRDEYIGGKRSRSSRCNYQYRSILICKEMFLHLYGSDSRLRRLKEHSDKYGIFPRTHGNTKRLPRNTLPQLVTENVHNFLANYVEVYCPLAKLKRVFGERTLQHVKLLEYKPSVTVNLRSCAISFIPMLLCPNPRQTYA